MHISSCRRRRIRSKIAAVAANQVLAACQDSTPACVLGRRFCICTLISVSNIVLIWSTGVTCRRQMLHPLTSLQAPCTSLPTAALVSNFLHIVLNLLHIVLNLLHIVFNLLHIALNLLHIVSNLLHIVPNLLHILFDLLHIVLNFLHIVFNLLHIVPLQSLATLTSRPRPLIMLICQYNLLEQCC